MDVTIPAGLSHSGKEYIKTVDVDSCIYDFVKMLNDNGFKTVACCCGHGKRPASIMFIDPNDMFHYKEIMIMSFEQARALDKMFPPINP